MIYFLVLLNFILNTYIFGIHYSSVKGAILTLICFISALLFYRDRKVNYKDPLVIAILLILVAIIGQALRNLIEGMDIETILVRMQPLYVYFYFLPLVIVLNSKNKIIQFIKLIKISAVLSAIFSIIQYITQISTSGSTGKYADDYFRVYHPDAYLMAVSLFIIVSEIILGETKIKTSKLNFVFAFLIILGILTTFHRNLIGATFIGLIIIVSTNIYFENKINIFKFTAVIFSLIFIGSIITEYIGISADAITDRVSTGIDDLINVEGNFSLRFALILAQFLDIWNYYPIFGKGFDFIPLSVDNYLKFDPYTLVADADYGNIVIIFGFSILLILIYIYYHLQNRALTNIKIRGDLVSKILALSIIPLPFFFIVIGFFAPISSEPPFLNPLISMIALIVVSNEDKSTIIHQ